MTGLPDIVGILFPAIFMAKLVSSYQRDNSDFDSSDHHTIAAIEQTLACTLNGVRKIEILIASTR